MVLFEKLDAPGLIKASPQIGRASTGIAAIEISENRALLHSRHSPDVDTSGTIGVVVEE
jgi:hypothetical protein